MRPAQVTNAGLNRFPSFDEIAVRDFPAARTTPLVEVAGTTAERIAITATTDSRTGDFQQVVHSRLYVVV
jgi:hypothetical protein